MNTPVMGLLQAPPHWQALDLLSDLHLQASQPQTFEAWKHHMLHTPAQAVLLLGDVFEVWVGDDALGQDAFVQSCAQVLRECARTRTVGFMPGNRDFLVGPAFLSACGVQALADPTVLVWGSERILLTHGDALCLDDEAYQRFRQVARTAEWQQAFLSRPLAERLALAQSMRAQSEAHNQSMQSFADADPQMTRQWLTQAHSQWLIHGHTHRPADHVLTPLAPGQPPARRQVLSDWDLQAPTPRAQILRLGPDGQAQRIDVAAT